MTENRGVMRLVTSSAIGAVCALALSFALMLAMAAILLSRGQSETLEKTAVGISLFLGGAAGGLISEKRSHGGIVFCGLMAGALLLAMLCIAGLIGYGAIDFTNSGGLVALCALLGAFAGALLGSGRSKKKHKHK